MTQPDPSPAADDRSAGDPSAADRPRVDVYWRPGCPFCTMLFRGLRGAGLPLRELDIWEDPEAAAFVRAHANGNETVPTVDIAGTVLVNPSAKTVLDLAAKAGIA